MGPRARVTEESSGTTGRGELTEYLLALIIGACVGAGLAAIWIPERRHRRLPAIAAERYRRVRRASAAALDEIREAGRELTGEFREELGVTLEAAREELRDMARQQLEQAWKALRRQRRERQG